MGLKILELFFVNNGIHEVKIIFNSINIKMSLCDSKPILSGGSIRVSKFLLLSNNLSSFSEYEMHCFVFYTDTIILELYLYEML